VKPIASTEVRSPAERHVAMSWAHRLKRVCNIDSAYAISTLTFAIAVVSPSKSSPASRARTSSIASWLIFERKNKAALPYRTWCQPPEHSLDHYLFSQGANPQPQISKDATKKRVARTVACYRSDMDGYALCDHSHRQTFSEADRLALIFLAAVTHIDEAIFSR
jgi:hypothetical protein